MTNKEKFLEYCGMSAGNTTLIKIEQKYRIFDDFFKQDLDKINLQDIHRFLSWLNKTEYARATKNDIIKVFKRFLKWKYKNWSIKFNELRDVKINSNNASRNLSKEDLLTADEMQMIVNSTDSMKFKTLLLFFQETACRPEEVLKLKWKEIDLNKEEVKLHSSKTGKTRFIPIKKTADHLRRYKLECFATLPKADDKVFDVSGQNVIDHLKRIEIKLKLNKHLYPYLWRHSILSKMIKVLSPKVYEMYSGHALETGMRIYAHLDNDDLREELFDKVYNLKPLTPEEQDELRELRTKIENLTAMVKKQQLAYTTDLKKVIPTIKKKILEDIEDGFLKFDEKKKKLVFTENYKI